MKRTRSEALLLPWEEVLFVLCFFFKKKRPGQLLNFCRTAQELSKINENKIVELVLTDCKVGCEGLEKVFHTQLEI